MNSFKNDIKEIPTEDLLLILEDQVDLYTEEELEILKDELASRPDASLESALEERKRQKQSEEDTEREKQEMQKAAEIEKERLEAENKKSAEERERNRKLREDRLNSLRYRGYEGYYEYKTVVINDNSDGGVWAETISSTLNNLALDGWRLVSSYTNELGHNSKPGSVLSAGTNATIDEHIFILERFIKL